MEQPLVSVVIPFYSEINWLIEAVESVLAQTYKNVEILIINDGSNVDLQSIFKKYGCSHLKVIKKENGGPASARNYGIQHSNGKYIAFLDSDDIWLPNKLTEQISEMETNKFIWSHHSYEKFWNNKNKKQIVNTSVYSGNILRDCFISLKIQTSCVVVLKNILIEEDIKFPIKRRYGQDLDFYIQIAKKYPIGYVNGVYSRFRIRGSNAGSRAKIQIEHKAYIWQKISNDGGRFISLPKLVILAYKLTSFINNIINYLDPRMKRKNMIELISKFMYVLPYSIFKLYSR